MKNQKRGASPFAGLTIAAILLASTVGYVSALSRAFQSTDPVDDAEETHFRYSEEESSRPAPIVAAANYDASFVRTAPAWFVNAMPGYSSGRAREMWYLSLDRSNDSRLTLADSGGYNSTANPYAPMNRQTYASISPATFIAEDSLKTGSAPLAPTVNGTVYTWSTTTTSTAWLTVTNWTVGGNASTKFPGDGVGAVLNEGTATDIAAIGADNLSANQIGINYNTLGGGLSLAAIDFTATSNGPIAIGNSSTTVAGTMTLNGATFNAIDNTILINEGANLLTLQNFQGSNTTRNMDIALGNATENIVQITGTGGITISSIVKDGAGTKLTLNGTGSGIFTLSGTAANTYSGLTTVNVGEMDLSKTAGVNAIAGNLTIGDGNGAANTATVKLINADQIADASDVTINSDGVLNLNGKNETIDALNSSSSTASILLGAGTLTVGANNETTFAYAGTTSGTGGLTKTGTGILLLTGSNTYTGDTTIKQGELELTGAGSLSSSSTIRLGDTAGSNSAMFTFGNTNGGMTVASPMIVQASGGGTRTILGLATNGNTNIYSGNITMNTDLIVQSAAQGGSVANGPGILLFQGGTIDVGTSTLIVNSNLRGNNADTYSIQGTVRMVDALASSLATGGSILKDGSGTLILESPANTYTGIDPSALNPNGTRIAGGILGIFGDSSLGLAPTNGTNNIFFIPPTTSTNVDSIAPTLRADADNIVLAATRNVNVAGGVTAQFDSNGNTFTIAGNINGAGNVKKIGLGTLSLTNANTYTGTTTVNAGTLNAAAANSLGATSTITVNSGGTLLMSDANTTNRIGDASNMTLNGGTFNTAGLSEHGAANNDFGIGQLTLQSSSIIDLGSGSSIIAFANSALQSANWNGTLSIYNWSGTILTGNGTDQLYFGNDATGLTPSQLAQINFYSDNGTTFLGVGSWGTDLDGEVVPVIPVPEASTWIGAALALAAIGYSQRRKLRGLVGSRG